MRVTHAVMLVTRALHPNRIPTLSECEKVFHELSCTSACAPTKFNDADSTLVSFDVLFNTRALGSGCNIALILAMYKVLLARRSRRSARPLTSSTDGLERMKTCERSPVVCIERTENLPVSMALMTRRRDALAAWSSSCA